MWYPPTGVCARCRGYRPLLGAGTKRPVASPPLHNSPPGASRPLAPAGVGGGAWGSTGPLRTPGGPNCLYNETRVTRARTARAGCAAPAGVGDRGGDWGSRQVGPLTGWPHHPPRWSHSVRGSWGPAQGPWVPTQGSVGPTQGPSAPPVRSLCAGREGKGRRGREGKGHSRP